MRKFSQPKSTRFNIKEWQDKQLNEAGATKEDFVAYLQEFPKFAKAITSMMPPGVKLVKVDQWPGDSNFHYVWSRTIDGVSQVLSISTYDESGWKLGQPMTYGVAAHQDEVGPKTILLKLKKLLNGFGRSKNTRLGKDFGDTRSLEPEIALFASKEGISKLAKRLKPTIDNTFTKDPFGGQDRS
jgi:hypothetical protein